MARTQFRLDSVTGSLADIDAVSSVKAAAGSIAADHLQDVLGQFAGAIKRIHGESTFTDQAAGTFKHTAASFTGHLSASNDLVGGQDLKLTRDAIIGRNADVTGKADLRGVAKAYTFFTGSDDIILDKGSKQLIKRDGGDLQMQLVGAGRIFDVSTNGSSRFSVADSVLSSSVLAVVSDLRSEALVGGATAIVWQDGSKQFRSNANAQINGSGEIKAAALTASNLTANRVPFVGASQQLVDNTNFTYNGGTNVLTVNGSNFGNDVTIAGNLTINGTTTTVNSVTVTVDDKNLELGSVASPTDTTADGGGVTLKGATDKTILWSNTSKYWEFSEGILAPSGTFSNLASKLVKSDANGKLIDALAMDFVTGTVNQVNLAAGSLGGSVVLSLPQDIGTTSDVVFGIVSGSALRSNVKSAEYIYADAANGELKAGSFQASGDDMVLVDSPLGAVTYSLKFPISGSGAANTLVGTNYVGDDLSVFEALRSLDAQLKTTTDSLGASSKKATAEISSTKASGTDIKGDLSSNFIAELTVDNSMVFVNGQLMLSGALGAKDYTTDGGVLKFAFDLVADDVVVVQKA